MLDTLPAACPFGVGFDNYRVAVAEVLVHANFAAVSEGLHTIDVPRLGANASDRARAIPSGAPAVGFRYKHQ